MTTSGSRAKATPPKPVFSTGEASDDAAKSTADESPEMAAFNVEPSTVELDESDEVSDEDPHESMREEYLSRLDQLELEHGDSSARIDALELLVLSLCDTVLGKGILPVLRTNEEGTD